MHSSASLITKVAFDREAFARLPELEALAGQIP
jgi:hypothetical protein